MYLELLWEELDQEQREREEQEGLQRVDASGDVSAMGFNMTTV